MIKFFRKIRQKLLIENRFNKYLLYAIGEIILVVIGILIALQINNWNEDRKAAIQEKKALQDLLVEFKINHKDFMRVYKVKKQALDSINSYLNFILDNRIPASKKDFLFDGLARNTWDPNYAVLNGLFNSGTIGNLKNDSLKSYLSYWEGYVSNYMRLQENYHQIVLKYVDLRNTIPFRIDELNDYNVNSLEDKNSEIKKMVQSISYQNSVNNLKSNLRVQVLAMDQLIENYEKVIPILEKKND